MIRIGILVFEIRLVYSLGKETQVVFFEYRNQSFESPEPVRDIEILEILLSSGYFDAMKLEIIILRIWQKIDFQVSHILFYCRNIGKIHPDPVDEMNRLFDIVQIVSGISGLVKIE